MKSNKVIVLGDANVDMVLPLPDRSKPNADMTKAMPNLFGGGAGANTAVALARLGVNTSMMGAIGDDGYGRWVLEDLQKESVDISSMKLLKDKFTSMVMAVIEPDGERLVMVWPPEGGADLQLQEDTLDKEFISSANWLHVSGICMRPSPSQQALLRGMEIAKNAGVKISLDLNLRIEYWGLDENKRKAVLKAISMADVVMGNAKEEMMPLTNTNSAEDAAQAICDGKRIVIARDGIEGARCTSSKESFIAKGFSVDVVDTLGAGDAFNGGFIAGQLIGLSLGESIRWGNGVAAIKITKPGARGLPNMIELTKFLNGNENLN